MKVKKSQATFRGHIRKEKKNIIFSDSREILREKKSGRHRTKIQNVTAERILDTRDG